jgi:hypothetical protein
MNAFHTIQKMGKVRVTRIFRELFGYDTDKPNNYLQQCSLIYKEIKKGNIKALELYQFHIESQASELWAEKTILEGTFKNSY